MMARAVRNNRKSIIDNSEDSEVLRSFAQEDDVKDIKGEMERMIKDNPLNIFGIGILSQFNLMIHLIIIFSIFSLMSIPIILIYSNYDAMKGSTVAFASTTLGNLGFSSSSWFSVTKKFGAMELSCNTGVLNSEVGSFGIMPSDSSDKNYWVNGKGDSIRWVNRLDINGFKQQFMHAWANQKNWTLTNLDSYFLGGIDGWNNDDSILFLNVKCIQQLDVINSKRLKIHYIVCICILISLFYLIMLYYSTKSSEISAKEWDLKTITAGDYTVWRRINQNEYDDFLKMHTMVGSPVYDYMVKLKEEYEIEISNQPMVNEEWDDIKIANISFGFNNHKIINLLEKRGTAITNKDFKKKQLYDDEIDQLVHTSRKELTYPKFIFVTFETQEGYERAKKWKVDKKYQFQIAGEPTNIIWENLHNTTFGQIIKTIIVVFILVILLIATFYLFIFIKQTFSDPNKKSQSINWNSFDSKTKIYDAHLKYVIIIMLVFVLTYNILYNYKLKEVMHQNDFLSI